MNQTPTPQERACANCDGRKCMACVFREIHEDCEESCPSCCEPPMPPTDPQERANTTDAAEVLNSHWRRVWDDEAAEWRCDGCGGRLPSRPGTFADHQADMLAAASLLRQDPPQVAGEDVERVARAVADAQNVPFPGPKQRKIALAALAALSARPVEAQEVERRTGQENRP